MTGSAGALTLGSCSVHHPVQSAVCVWEARSEGLSKEAAPMISYHPVFTTGFPGEAAS